MKKTQTRLPAHAALALTCTLLASPLLAENSTPFRGLAAEMSEEQQRATGVESLSPAQRQALDAWLRTRIEGNAIPVSPAPRAPVAAPAPGLASAPATPSAPSATPAASQTAAASSAQAAQEAAIEAEVERRVAVQLATPQNAAEAAELGEPFDATLLGPFKGWTGKTLFRLDNGHVWKQRTKKRFFYNGSDLRVRFERNFMGGWEMTLIGADKRVLVAPVR